MTDIKKVCVHCGLPVEVFAFTLKTKAGNKVFCCERCKGIFQLLNEDELLSDADQGQSLKK